MGTSMSNLYGSISTPNLSYQEIDKLVSLYSSPDTSSLKKASVLSELLRSFHKYFMKYVKLLKGEASHEGSSIRNTDTMEFLALFQPGSEKAASHNWRLHTYNFISRICQRLEEGDIYNELCIRFIELLDNYIVYPGTSFTRYLTKHLRWSIKRWVVEMARGLQANIPLEAIDKSSTEENIFEYQDPESTGKLDLGVLDLHWIVKPESKLFGILSLYERFLLYLSFKKELGTRQIGNKLGRGKDTIHRHIREAISKLQNKYKKEEET